MDLLENREKFHEVKHGKSKVDEIECILVLRLSQLPTLYHSCESGNICKNRWKHDANDAHSRISKNEDNKPMESNKASTL